MSISKRSIELAQALDLEDEDLSALYEQLHARHIELRDDCTRQDAPEAPIDDAHFATVTTDTLQLFLNEIGRHRLLTPSEEIDLAKRIERGDLGGQGPHDQREPASGRLDRQEVPGLGADPARPDPGGHPRA